MMEALLVIVLGGFTYLYQGRPLRKKKDHRAFALFIALLLTGVAYYLFAVIFRFPLPRPTDVIAAALEPIWQPVSFWVKGEGSS